MRLKSRDGERKRQNEYEKFDNTMTKLPFVSHDEMKA